MVRLPVSSALLVAGALILAAGCQPTVPTPALPGGGAAPAGQYEVARTNSDGSPVRWDPCAPIRYVVSLRHAPTFALAEIANAVRAVEAESGLDFVYQGTTTERPPRDYASLRYGPGPLPVLISFATSEELPFGSPTASGWGQAVRATHPTTGHERYVSGQVVLRPSGWTAGLTSTNPLELMVRHELGHVVGLDHVPVTTEIMGIGGNGSARRWGPGDRAGLAKIGRAGGCLPPLP